MVEKIIVNPLNVRGRGNILSPKSIEDFTVYNSSLSYVDELYTMEYVASTVTVSLTASASSLNVGESIVLTATVLDDGTAVDGVTVSFTSGNLAIGTAVTGSDGVATLTTSTLTAGSHSIIATYGNAISSPVSVTVNKLTPTISIAKSGDVTVGTAYVISGTLSCSGSVKLYEDGSLIDTLTVSSGAFSKSITKSVTGNFSYYALFDGDSNYNSVTSSSVTVVVSDVAPSYDGITLTSDKSVLSYQDSDSCTLSAQLKNGSSAASVSGVTVEFFNGSTSLGTAQTDSTGKATKSYSSQGIGDISITAKVGSLVSKTYSLEDCRDYQPLTSNAHESRWTIPSGVTSSYSDNGWRISANGYKQVKLTDKLTTACSVEFTISDYSNVATQAVIVFAYTNGETTPNLAILQGGTSASNLRKVFTTQLDHDLIKGGKYRIEYTTSTIKVYENNALLGESTNTIGFPTRFEWHIGANGRYAIYKDLKVKPL